MAEFDYTPSGWVVYTTTNLDQFSLDPTNRKIDQRKLDRLGRGISRKNQLANYPILVDDNLVVQDGQHRLEVAKRLGLRIYFTFAQQSTEILDVASAAMNQDKWTSLDALHFYVSHGNDTYIKLNQFLSAFPNISLATVLSILRYLQKGRYGGIYDTVRDGELEISDDEWRVLMEVGRVSTSMGKYTVLNTQRGLVVALAKLVSHEMFDDQVLMDQLENSGMSVHRQVDSTAYLTELVSIYNYGKRANRRLRL